ncbi:MAG: hypothetical protein JRG86_01070 [Deltaproteobacteria bacterium]|nr:hypothetical protein [Deltaproteobacteria bacterium]
MLAATPQPLPPPQTALPQEQVWRSLGFLATGETLAHSLARSEQGDLAVGDDAGVTWWRGERRERAVLPWVRDLAFDAQGVLWIATADGLHRWEGPDRRPERRSLQGGERASRVHRIALAGSAMLLATDAGAYWSSQGRLFTRLPVSGRTPGVLRVALLPPEEPPAFLRGSTAGRPPPSLARAWVYGVGRLSLVRGIARESGLRVSDVRSLPLPRPADERLPVDLRVGPRGERLFLVFDDLIAWRPLDSDEALSEAGPWRVERPVLPPGARIRRLGWAARRVWLATDHGLLEAPSIEGPFGRAASPVGNSGCWSLLPAGPDSAVALCRQGLFTLDSGPARLGKSARAAVFTPGDSLPPDPPVAEIRRRALARAGLRAERGDRLWDGLRRRAFWPELALRFGAAVDRDRSRDRDQSFVSGETRRLRDRARDEGEAYDARIELEWDLGGLVYADESVDLSRELRQVVSLRDDVADEIHQLYFERQGIRQRLASREVLEPAERLRLRRRAHELEAGLDAWTGGWLSRWRATRPSSPDRQVRAGGRGQPHSERFGSGPDEPVERRDER